MDGTQLRALQAPLKERYRGDPDAALVTLAASGGRWSRPACTRRRAATGWPPAPETCCWRRSSPAPA